MHKNQSSRGTLASVSFTTNRQLSWACLLFVASFLTLSLAHERTKTSAHVTSISQTQRGSSVSMMSLQPRSAAPNCEQLLVECLANGGGAAACGSQYDACIDGGKRPIDTLGMDLLDFRQIQTFPLLAMGLRPGATNRSGRVASPLESSWLSDTLLSL